jgi:hypothetical protein
VRYAGRRPEEPTCTVDLEVRYAETDQMGVVHHAVYPVWFEVARTRAVHEAGQPYADIERAGYFLVVSGIDVTYREGARYGDVVRVTSWVDWAASRAPPVRLRGPPRRGAARRRSHPPHLGRSLDRSRHCRWMPADLTAPFLADSP